VIEDAYPAIALRAGRSPGTSARSVAAAIVRSSRPRQWVKNVLLLGAPAAAGVLGRPEALTRLAALDLPAGARGLARLLDGWDALVAGAGGRVYLANDARLRPDALRAMYPGLDAWRAARAQLDPRGVMRARRRELAP
jgi:decaprenylphospho-beta-D-ribofuranose 2-oxidase